MPTMPKLAERRRPVPQRTCIACRTTTGKRELVRIVRTPEGQVIPDATGKAAGRGAYLCTNPDCWEQARRKRLFDKALKTTVKPADGESLWQYGLQFAQREEA
jgi:predicted RNA-binding protein YlxR (DUF448 family)